MGKTTATVIVKLSCDKSMAIKKGVLQKCNEDCKRCFCCIEMDENGKCQHVNLISTEKKIYMLKEVKR